MSKEQEYRDLYNQGKEVVPDYVYDAMFKNENTEDKGVGELCEHLHFMGSLPTYFIDFENLTDEDLVKLIPSFEKDKLYNISFKVDGVPGSVWYEKGKPVNCLSRGKRTEGHKMSNDFLKIVPQSIQLNIFEDIIDIRGEFYITYNDFNELNKLFDDKFANPRSMVSSCVNSLNPDKRIMDKIKFLSHGIWIGNQSSLHIPMLRTYMNEQFVVPSIVSTCSNLIKSLKHVYNYAFKKNDEIPVDGIVIQHSVTSENDGHCNLDRIAIKQLDEEKFSSITKVNNIEWIVKSDGELMPRIWFDEVEINGSKVVKCSGHVYDFIKTMNISIGAKVKIVMRGGVIPYLHEVIEEGNGDIQLPENHTFKEGDNIHVWIGDNDNEFEKNRLVRGGCSLEFESFGEKFWESIYENGYKSMFDVIDDCRDGSIKKTIGTCFPNTEIGLERYNDFVNKMTNLEYYQTMLANCIKGIGEKSAKYISECWYNGETIKKNKYISEFLSNEELVDKIKSHSNNKKIVDEFVLKPNKKKVCLTKSPSNGMKKQQFFDMFLSNTYEMTDSLTNADLLICPIGETSNKVKQAEKKNIPIKYYEDYIQKDIERLKKEQTKNEDIPSDFI